MKGEAPSPLKSSPRCSKAGFGREARKDTANGKGGAASRHVTDVSGEEWSRGRRPRLAQLGAGHVGRPPPGWMPRRTRKPLFLPLLGGGWAL